MCLLCYVRGPMAHHRARRASSPRFDLATVGRPAPVGGLDWARCARADSLQIAAQRFRGNATSRLHERIPPVSSTQHALHLQALVRMLKKSGCDAGVKTGRLGVMAMGEKADVVVPSDQAPRISSRSGHRRRDGDRPSPGASSRCITSASHGKREAVRRVMGPWQHLQVRSGQGPGRRR